MTNVPPIPAAPTASAVSPPKGSPGTNPTPTTTFKSHLQGPGKRASRLASALSIQPSQFAGGRRASVVAGQNAVVAGDDARGKQREGESEQSPEGASSGSSPGVDLLDPLTRVLLGDGSHRLAFERSAGGGPSGTASPSVSQPDTVSLASRVSVEHVMTRFVRKVAWSGDAHSGTARLELGAGALAGATLTIHSDQGAVRVSLELPPGVDAAAWRERIARRLGARGLQVAALDVQ